MTGESWRLAKAAREGQTMGKCEYFRLSATAKPVTAMMVMMMIMVALRGAAAAEPDKNDLSDKSVRVLTGFALTTIPSEIVRADGSVVKIDKSDVSKIILPYDDAKRVIKAGRLSALAQECDMAAVQEENYHRLMETEHARNKWSREQMLFINRLHLFTVMWLTGNVKFTEKDPKADTKPMSEADVAKAKAEADAAAKARQRVCTAQEKETIKSSIDSFWKTAQK